MRGWGVISRLCQRHVAVTKALEPHHDDKRGKERSDKEEGKDHEKGAEKPKLVPPPLNDVAHSYSARQSPVNEDEQTDAQSDGVGHRNPRTRTEIQDDSPHSSQKEESAGDRFQNAVSNASSSYEKTASWTYSGSAGDPSPDTETTVDALGRISGKNFGGWSSAAPQISEEDERREWEALPSEERQRILADIYGRQTTKNTTTKGRRKPKYWERVKQSHDAVASNGPSLSSWDDKHRLEDSTSSLIAPSARKSPSSSSTSPKMTAEENPDYSSPDDSRDHPMVDLKDENSRPMKNESESSDEEQYEEQDFDEDEIARSLLRSVETEIPLRQREAFSEACQKCPSEAKSTSHLMMFWRWSEGNVENAAHRLVAYWDERLNLFGEDEAFQRIELENRSNKEWVAVSTGYLRPVTVLGSDGSATELQKDRHGRPLILMDARRNLAGDSYSTNDMLRVMWWTLQKLLETHVDAQRTGLVFLAMPKDASMAQLNRKLFLRFWSLCSKTLPVAVRALHLCRPLKPNRSSLRPIYMHIVGEFIRVRTVTHIDRPSLAQDLEAFGMDVTCLPIEAHGVAVIDHYRWLCEVGGDCVPDRYNNALANQKRCS